MILSLFFICQNLYIVILFLQNQFYSLQSALFHYQFDDGKSVSLDVLIVLYIPHAVLIWGFLWLESHLRSETNTPCALPSFWFRKAFIYSLILEDLGKGITKRAIRISFILLFSKYVCYFQIECDRHPKNPVKGLVLKLPDKNITKADLVDNAYVQTTAFDFFHYYFVFKLLYLSGRFLLRAARE